MSFKKSKEENYFEMFKVLSGHINQAAKKFDNLINNYNNIEYKCREIEDLEHTADKQVQKIYAQLNHSFITPIDREDIFLIAKRLDQVCDQIDSTAQRFMMYDIKDVTEEAKGFSRLAVKCCEHIDILMEDLKHIKKIKNIKNINESIQIINDIEHEGDNLYHLSVKQLFQKQYDAIYIIKWREMYRSLEKILDACEDFANTILSVVMKNS